MPSSLPSSPRPQTRPMTVFDGFIYNFLAMGVIFPWVYLWGPAAFPGSDIRLALLIAFAVQIPIAISYCLLACIFPVNGGDYVYQSRAFGLLGAVSVMSGFVVWILQWVALSGWLFSQLGLAPLFMAVGVKSGIRQITVLATLLESPGGCMLVTIALAIFAVLFLRRGMALFVSVQRILFLLTIAAMAAIIYIFVRTPPNLLALHLNDFSRDIITQLRLQQSLPQGMSKSFMSFVIEDALRTPISLSAKFSWVATLGVVPIAWTSLQWSTYSVEQNAEIKGGKRLANQLIMLVGSAATVTAILIILVTVENRAMSLPFTLAASQIFSNGNGSPFVVSFMHDDLQPFPSVLAIAASGNNIFLSAIIAFGFLANAFQVTCNCFIGVSRIIVRMSRDGILPQGLQLHNTANDRDTPRRAYWFYLIASLPVIVGYFMFSRWKGYTLGVTLSCGYVFALSSLSLARIPWTRARRMILQSEVRDFSRWGFAFVGFMGFILSASMVASYVLVGNYQLADRDSVVVVLCVILVCGVVIVGSRRMARHRFGLPDLGAGRTADGVNSRRILRHITAQVTRTHEEIVRIADDGGDSQS